MLWEDARFSECIGVIVLDAAGPMGRGVRTKGDRPAVSWIAVRFDEECHGLDDRAFGLVSACQDKVFQLFVCREEFFREVAKDVDYMYDDGISELPLYKARIG